MKKSTELLDKELLHLATEESKLASAVLATTSQNERVWVAEYLHPF